MTRLNRRSPSVEIDLFGFVPAWVWLILLFGLAAGFQSSIASRVGFFGGAPDFLLTLTLTAALLADAATGAIVGFVGGLLAAAVAGQTVGTYIASRTFTAWQAAWTTGRFIESRPWVVVLGVCVGTLATEILYVLGYPHIRLSLWWRATLVSALMNALLSIPTYFMLKRLGWQKDSK
ncbi:MAG: rod shape-determining protein MreD [Armatimonas sp.]